MESGGLEELPPASVRNSSASVDTDVTQVDTPNVDQVCIFNRHTVCPRSSDPFYIVSYYVTWVTTSWAYCRKHIGSKAMPQSPCENISPCNSSLIKLYFACNSILSRGFGY